MEEDSLFWRLALYSWFLPFGGVVEGSPLCQDEWLALTNVWLTFQSCLGSASYQFTDYTLQANEAGLHGKLAGARRVKLLCGGRAF